MDPADVGTMPKADLEAERYSDGPTVLKLSVPDETASFPLFSMYFFYKD